MKGWIVMDVLGESIANHKIIILEVRYDKILIEFNKLYNYMYFAAVKHILLLVILHFFINLLITN